MAAKLTVNQGLCWCVLTFFIACANCLNSLPCIEVKRAYTEKGGNENEVPIQAISGDHLEVCPRGDGYTCCTRDMEIKLRELSAKEYDSLVDQSFRYVQSTFVSRTRKFDEFFTELLHNAKKDLHEMFVKTYGLLYRENAEIFTQLFEDLLKYYKGTDKSLTSTLDKFFENLLRRMFQLLNVQHKFDDVYLKCVTSKMDQLKPFGAVPQKLSSQVRRSFIAARTFVQGLAIGRDVILEVAKLRPTPACTKALMRMSYCPQCRGLTQTKPCNNYCLNTMKGCLAYHAELNILWNDYIEAMKQLAIRLEGPFNIESVVDPIDVKISDAIMILQENSITVRDQIFEGCGKPRTQSSGVRGKRSADNSTVGTPTQDHHGQPPITPVRQADGPQENPFGGKLNFGAGEVVPETGDAAEKKNPYDQHFVGQYKPPGGKNVKPTTAAGTSLDRLVRDIKDKVKAAKDFWIQLPYSVCNDDKIAAQPDNDDECWNGQDRARYEAEVQKDGVINQINNPEVTVDVNEANYIIEQQKIQLKIITDKLQTAYKGGDVTYIYTETVTDHSGDSSGDDDLETGSGFNRETGSGIIEGSGSGDGADRGDDEDYHKNKNHWNKNKHGHGGKVPTKSDPTGNKEKPFDFGPEYHNIKTTPRPVSGNNQPRGGNQNSANNLSSISISCLITLFTMLWAVL
ncbi:glypican-6-like [Mytilus edulis]|uniref:glypican-6-like n=1 Tax=Mytilus edulis TaxID=6550 RepID=UPI0039F1198A